MKQDERRDYFRVSIDVEGDCLLIDKKTADIVSAKILDLSPKGLRLKLHDEECDSRFVVEDNEMSILDGRLEITDVDLAGRTVRIIWKKDSEFGGLFVDSESAEP